MGLFKSIFDLNKNGKRDPLESAFQLGMIMDMMGEFDEEPKEEVGEYPEWWDTREDGNEYGIFSWDFETEWHYNRALSEAKKRWESLFGTETPAEFAENERRRKLERYKAENDDEFIDEDESIMEGE